MKPYAEDSRKIKEKESNKNIEGGAHGKMGSKDDPHEANNAVAWDDVSGESLDPKQVLKARLKELEYIREKGVWKKIKRKEANLRGI